MYKISLKTLKDSGLFEETFGAAAAAAAVGVFPLTQTPHTDPVHNGFLPVAPPAV